MLSLHPALVPALVVSSVTGFLGVTETDPVSTLTITASSVVLLPGYFPCEELSVYGLSCYV